MNKLICAIKCSNTAVIAKKLVVLIFGFIVLSFASVFIYQANIGLGPWDALHDGVAKVTGITYGQASIVVGLIILVYDFLSKERLGFGTLLNIVVIGGLIDLILMLNIVPRMSGELLPGVLYAFVGMTLLALGIWIYVGAAFGAGPRDSLMVILTRKTKLSVGICRAMTEGTALVLGWLLGGQIGVGTVIMTLLGGPIMQMVFKTVKFDIKAVRHQTFSETIKLIAADFKKSAKPL